MPDNGNTAQNRVIMDQVAETAITLFAAKNPQLFAKPPEVHPLVKWVVGAVAALGLAAIIGGGTWLVSSVSEMQVTLARMDERQEGQIIASEGRYVELERRVGVLEGYHRGNGR